MKRLSLLKSVAAAMLAGAVLATSASAKQTECTTIQDKTLVTSTGDIIMPGYDQWGYNYQARIFNGGYCDVYRDAAWCQAYKDIDLVMKWNGPWLDNKDCDDDTLLDRHEGTPSYIGSGAWLTNQQSGTVDINGRARKWTYFIKIIAVADDATLDDGVWYAADGGEIGPVIWGQFAIVQEVLNDPSSGAHGVQYLSPTGPGMGFGHIQ